MKFLAAAAGQVRQVRSGLTISLMPYFNIIFLIKSNKRTYAVIDIYVTRTFKNQVMICIP